MEQLEQDTIVTLLDADNNEVKFDVLMSFDYEGKRYVAMLPVDTVEGVGDDEVIILEDVKAEGILKPIDNPILLDEVFDEFMSLWEDEMDGEEE